MQDGQTDGTFAPDREEEDPTDLEYDDSPASDSDVEDEPTNVDAIDQGGMHDSSFEHFLDEWSDDDNASKVEGSGADSHPKPKKAPLKQLRADGSTSGAAASKGEKDAVVVPKREAPQTGRTRA